MRSALQRGGCIKTVVGDGNMWRVRARGRHRKLPGTMNKVETAYSQHLSLRQRAGEIDWFAYEAVKLRLAPKTFFTVDFMLMLHSGELEAHEVKGSFVEDDAMVKIKVAAQTYPFRFVMVRQERNGWWDLREVGCV